ncbi:hypothetical protein M4578_13380 [Salipiger sp. P9]|uniref:hypothetical protein n=1 Tax=Salipiger pentaromativorans TaxID=2943193 RepID=UPI0021585483|nr:hypothetical protein [Salipiger pentaromativorans]MCR8548824.1 hypothetical protein [Salipiger pentaromativorans]
MPELTPWAALPPERQLALREAYAADPACLTGTCSLERKTAAFADWLAAQGVAFSEADLHPGRRA